MIGDLITWGIGTPGGVTPLILSGLAPSGTGDPYLITLGIGTPGGIAPLVLFGLSPSGPEAIGAEPHTIITVAATRRVIAAEAMSRIVGIPSIRRTIKIPERPS